MRAPPDDPCWLTTPADLRVMDAQVLRQVGVPEAIIELATRERVADSARSERTHSYQAIRGNLFEYDDVPEADPHWEDETSCPPDHRRW